MLDTTLLPWVVTWLVVCFVIAIYLCHILCGAGNSDEKEERSTPPYPLIPRHPMPQALPVAASEIGLLDLSTTGPYSHADGANAPSGYVYVPEYEWKHTVAQVHPSIRKTSYPAYSAGATALEKGISSTTSYPTDMSTLFPRASRLQLAHLTPGSSLSCSTRASLNVNVTERNAVYPLAPNASLTSQSLDAESLPPSYAEATAQQILKPS